MGSLSLSLYTYTCVHACVYVLSSGPGRDESGPYLPKDVARCSRPCAYFSYRSHEEDRRMGEVKGTVIFPSGFCQEESLQARRYLSSAFGLGHRRRL